MRTIDSDSLKAEIESLDAESNKHIYKIAMEDMLRFFVELIDKQPTIEPEVRHGRWIFCEDQHGVDNDNNNYAYFCSQCHYQDVHSKYAKVNFCWNCGSDMREGGADNG